MQYLESDTLALVAIVALVGWLFWLHHKRQQQRSELKRTRLQLSSKALEKFSSASEFLAFIQSDEGQSILCDNEVPNRNRPGPNIRFVQIGVLLVFVGIGLFLSAHRYQGTPSPDLKDLLALMNFSGTILISTGVGFFVVAIITSLWEKWFGEHESSSPTIESN
jgi:hypothetical protein